MFPFDSIGLKFMPLSIDIRRAKIEHGLSAGNGPPHAGAFHAVLDRVTAGPFDHAAGNGVAGSRVFVVTPCKFMVSA
jgi:hypothetical protein